MKRKEQIGRIFEGRWEVTGFKPYDPMRKMSGPGRFILRNVYNGREVEIDDSTYARMLDGRTSVSWIISKRIVKKAKKTGIVPYFAKGGFKV